MNNKEFEDVNNYPNVKRVTRPQSEKQAVYYYKLAPDAVRETSDYSLLRENGLSVPHARHFNDKKRLLVEDAGIPVGHILKDKPEIAIKVFESALEDLLNMWEKTKTSYDLNKISRDYTAGSLNTIKNLSSFGYFNPKLPIEINGTAYPKLEEIFKLCQKGLLEKQDKYMVISHGDEYPLNITARQDKNGEYTGEHFFIDPRNSGYYNVSTLLNIILGQSLLHTFSFVCNKTETPQKVTISYSIQKEDLQIYKDFKYMMSKFIEKVENKVEKPQLLREYLFCNLARVIDEKNYLEKYRDKISPSKDAFFAIGTEILFEKYEI